jgi:hypothetical protein
MMSFVDPSLENPTSHRICRIRSSKLPHSCVRYCSRRPHNELYTMTTADDLDYVSYISDLVYTLLFVFQRIIPTDMLLQWLRPMITDDDQRAMLIHEEPLYVAADFLGIDRHSPSFHQYETHYLKFRTEFLSRQNTAPPRTMVRTLNRLLPKAGVYSHRVDTGRDSRIPDPSVKHFSTRHYEDAPQFVTLSKETLRPEHTPPIQFRKDTSERLHRNRKSARIRSTQRSGPSYRRTNRVFTTKHATEDMALSG